MENSNHSETTPLLISIQHEEPFQLPSISSTLLRIQSLDVRTLQADDICPPPIHPSHIVPTTAFKIITLLRLRELELNSALPKGEIYEKWLRKRGQDQAVTSLDDLIVRSWALFLETYRSTPEILQVLTTPFPLEDEDTASAQIIHFLATGSAPVEFLKHPVVVESIRWSWCRRGRSGDASEVGFPWLLQKYDGIATPRISHLIDLASQAIFVCTLVTHILYPTWEDVLSDRSRRLALATLSLSFTIRSRTIANICYIPTLLAVTLVPSATTLLLVGLALQLLRLYLPYPPSPLFLAPFEKTLPLSVVLLRSIQDIVIPPLLFFLPVFFVVSVLLSVSLGDAFIHLLAFTPFPIEARLTFSFLLSVAVMFLVLTTTLLLAGKVTVWNASPHESDSPWDCYTVTIGLKARVMMYNAASALHTPYDYPAPFNLVHLFLIGIPATLSRKLGIVMNFRRTERILWRVIVGPFVAITAGFIFVVELALDLVRLSQN